MSQKSCSNDKMSWLEYCESIHNSLEKNGSSGNSMKKEIKTRLINVYNGWNLMEYEHGTIIAKCPHCEYSAPYYIDTSDTMLFKYCPNCGSKLFDEACIINLEQACLENNDLRKTKPGDSIILPKKLRNELSKYIDDCYSSVSSRYVGRLADSKNCSEMCNIFSECIRYFRQKNSLSNQLSDEVKAVPNSNNSVDIVFPDWVILNIGPKYSIQER